jgi:hypothetical protein
VVLAEADDLTRLQEPDEWGAPGLPELALETDYMSARVERPEAAA